LSDGPLRWQTLGSGVGGTRWRLQAEDGAWFVKTAQDVAELFEAEADGLKALAEAGALRVPRMLECGVSEDEAFILMEWLPLSRKDAVSAARLGEALAHQHLMHADKFGWRRHNFIGATPQFNTLGDDWVGFFREQRLGFQLRLAAENGYVGELQVLGARLRQELPKLFAGYAPRPVLLHGDLWGGNWGATTDGAPVVFDPAVYRGDREADMAMTELFGGFGLEFYAAYRAHAPLDPGYAVRRHLYNLYHVLNHLNLFGEAYLSQAEALLQRLLVEIG
jgi:fructosamine-3-kinase